MKKKVVIIIVKIVLALGVGLFVTYHVSFLNLSSPKVVTYDIKQTVANFSHQLALANLSVEKQQKTIQQFSQALQTTLIQYAKDNDVIIVKSGTVIAGAPNQTTAINQAVLKRLKSLEDGHEAA